VLIVRADPDPDGGSEPAAQVGGRLIINDNNGCVLLDHGAGLPASAVVWPAGTELREDKKAAVLPDGQVVEEGDRVSGQGGGGPMSALLDLRDSIEGGDVSEALRCVGEEGGYTMFAAAGTDMTVTS
jgi:hypothetical protein